MSIDLQTLQAFCSNDPTRPNLHAPFYIGEFTYATDGVIAIRIPGKLTRNPKPRAMRAGPEPLFKRHLFFHPDFLHMLGDFTIPAPASIPCVECQMLEKPDPGCDECSGSGAILEYPAARLSRDGRAFDCRYLAAIAALPEAELCDAPPPNPVDLVNAAAFRFSGGYGLLMPLTKIRSRDPILLPQRTTTHAR